MKPDFEHALARYPNNRGRAAAERHFNRTVKTEKQMADLLAAQDAYFAFLAKPENEFRRAKDASAFFNQWADWKVETPPEKPAQATLASIRTHYCDRCEPPHDWPCALAVCEMGENLVCIDYLDGMQERYLAAEQSFLRECGKGKGEE